MSNYNPTPQELADEHVLSEVLEDELMEYAEEIGEHENEN